MQRVLWFFVVALLAVDVLLLVQRERLQARFGDLQRKSAAATLKTEYAAEEEALITKTGTIPASFPLARDGNSAGDTVQFLLLVSVDDCTNSIEDEVTRLNQWADKRDGRIAGIHGFFVDENRPEMARRFMEHLSPAPRFPFTVADPRVHLPEATTPLVLIIRTRDGKILDAHKPIPDDLTKRDAFYMRWAAALGMS